MGIPIKGSRKLVYGPNQSFRFIVKETHIPDHKDQKELLVTVQEDVPKPGNVMQFRAAYGKEITPKTIAYMIGRAIKAGWDPSKRGGAFRLTRNT